jgi:hypothetical protein
VKGEIEAKINAIRNEGKPNGLNVGEAGDNTNNLAKVTCKVCTLENDFGNEKCIMCDSPLV